MTKEINLNTRWRRKKYRCEHTDIDEITGEASCSLALCQLPVLLDCCVDCEEYEGPDRGLGDTIKRATNSLGISSCGSCEERRKKLNKVTQGIYNKLGRKP